MSTISQVAETLQRVLTEEADTAARETGFVQRESKLSGSRFVQTLVLSWMANGQASLSEMVRTAGALGVQVSEQGLDQRFGPPAAQCLQRSLQAAVRQAISAEPAAIPVLARFNGVFTQDATTLVLPDVLEDLYQGCGGNSAHQTAAAMKLQVRYDLSRGELVGPYMQDGRAADTSEPFAERPLPPGALRIADLGYFSLTELAQLNAQGIYWLTRAKAKVGVQDAHGCPMELLRLLEGSHRDVVDMAVRMGSNGPLPCRLMAVRVPEEVAQTRRRRLRKEAGAKGKTPSQERLRLCGWTIYLTNAPVEMLSVEEALALGRARWQIELLFKCWKSQGLLDEWRTQNPWRVLSEIYAKLIGLLAQHWLILKGTWCQVDRSMGKALQTVQRYAVLLTTALAGRIDLDLAIELIVACLSVGCRMNRRRAQPNTYQRLLAASPGGLA